MAQLVPSSSGNGFSVVSSAGTGLVLDSLTQKPGVCATPPTLISSVTLAAGGYQTVCALPTDGVSNFFQLQGFLEFTPTFTTSGTISFYLCTTLNGAVDPTFSVGDCHNSAGTSGTQNFWTVDCVAFNTTGQSPPAVVYLNVSSTQAVTLGSLILGTTSETSPFPHTMWTGSVRSVLSPLTTQVIGDSNLSIAFPTKTVQTVVSFAAPRTLTFPNANTYPAGSTIVWNDTVGNAVSPTNYLAIAAVGGNTIDGSTGSNWGLSVPGRVITFTSNGSNAWTSNFGQDILLFAGGENFYGEATSIVGTPNPLPVAWMYEYASGNGNATAAQDPMAVLNTPSATVPSYIIAPAGGMSPAMPILRQYATSYLAPNRSILAINMGSSPTYGSVVDGYWSPPVSGSYLSNPAIGTGTPQTSGGLCYLSAIKNLSYAMSHGGLNLAGNNAVVGIFWISSQTDGTSSSADSAPVPAGIHSSALLGLVNAIRANGAGCSATTPFILGSLPPDWVAGQSSTTTSIPQIAASDALIPSKIAYTAYAAGPTGNSGGALSGSCYINTNCVTYGATLAGLLSSLNTVPTTVTNPTSIPYYWDAPVATATGSGPAGTGATVTWHAPIVGNVVGYQVMYSATGAAPWTLAWSNGGSSGVPPVTQTSFALPPNTSTTSAVTYTLIVQAQTTNAGTFLSPVASTTIVVPAIVNPPAAPTINITLNSPTSVTV